MEFSGFWLYFNGYFIFAVLDKSRMHYYELWFFQQFIFLIWATATATIDNSNNSQSYFVAPFYSFWQLTSIGSFFWHSTLIIKSFFPFIAYTRKQNYLPMDMLQQKRVGAPKVNQPSISSFRKYCAQISPISNPFQLTTVAIPIPELWSRFHKHTHFSKFNFYQKNYVFKIENKNLKIHIYITQCIWFYSAIKPPYGDHPNGLKTGVRTSKNIFDESKGTKFLYVFLPTNENGN